MGQIFTLLVVAQCNVISVTPHGRTSRHRCCIVIAIHKWKVSKCHSVDASRVFSARLTSIISLPRSFHTNWNGSRSLVHPLIRKRFALVRKKWKKKKTVTRLPARRRKGTRSERVRGVRARMLTLVPFYLSGAITLKPVLHILKPV